jgi:hypothetical protein
MKPGRRYNPSARIESTVLPELEVSMESMLA